jgi:hypothetical protein
MQANRPLPSPTAHCGRVALAAGSALLFAGTAAASLTATENQLWHLDTPLIDGVAVADDRFGSAIATGDFDADGYDDVAIGIPRRDFLFGVDDIGAVLVLYGSPGGLGAAGHQILTQGAGLTEQGDQFGRALASGDFDDDGYDDLAVGAPLEDLGASQQILNAGAVSVFYGSAAGLGEPELWHQNVAGVAGAAEDFDGFGASLAVGDFDLDGCDDLAVGSPGDSVDGLPEAGLVHVLYGSSSGITADGSQRFRQGYGGLADTASAYDVFGFSLTTGDFDDNGYDDLVIGVPSEDLAIALELFPDAGRVHVLYGGPGGLDASDSTTWDQGSDGITGVLESDDLFGYSVAAGDVDGNGVDDLAVGTPGQATGLYKGQVHLLFGGPSGVGADGNLVVNEASDGIWSGGVNNFFGEVLATGNIDGNGGLEVIVGTPHQRLRRVGEPPLEDAGGAWVLRGGPGPTVEPAQWIGHQENGVAAIAGPADEDLFGAALGVGDFDGDGTAELAVGLPHREVSGRASAGAVVVLTSRLFSDGFESGDTGAWSATSP